MQQIKCGNVRVQLLSNDIVHLEYAKDGQFCDENTFFIPNKKGYAKNTVVFTQEENVIRFGEYELLIPENAKSLSGVRLEKNGKKVYSYKKLANSGELPPLDKMPEVFAISDTPRIIIPEGGYSVERKGEYTVEENVQDVYLLLCNKNAKKLRKLYVELTGKPELVRLSTLGGWNSKYYAYTEEEAKQVILDYEKHNVPLDVMVIDTDWRSCENGWGYDINTNLFPNMKRFLDFAHEHGVEIMFNDHPEPVNGAHVFKPEEIEYREKNLQSLMEKGLDIWWYDRNWTTSLISPTDKIHWETFGLYLFDDITRNYYKKQAQSNNVYRRPVLMGNAVNVLNGTYLNISDSASHRYSIQWTGDIDSSVHALAQEVDNLIKCSNNCIPYINADCGGHLGNPDKEQFIRWMQFGTFSPVFRPHCTLGVSRFREPWVYDTETLDIVREYNNLRYRLLPVIYKNAYNAYETGEPIFKSLGWEYPEDKKALKCENAYMLGNNILVKPIVGGLPTAVEENCFVSAIKATYYDGIELKGEPILKTEYKKLDMYLNHTAPEKGVPVYNFSARFEAKVKFDKDKRLFLRSDDGATVWIDGKKVHEDKTAHPVKMFPLAAVEGGKEYTVEIDYFQAEGEAAIGLYCCDVADDGVTEVYLPVGKWLDVFNGKIYNGGKRIKRIYRLSEMPILVRLGALLPLAYAANNTKNQKWDKLVYDFYPCKESCDRGYLYEDDTETTAYKLGQFRKSAYEAHYNEKENAYVIKLRKAEGSFDGNKCFTKREIAIRYHVLGAKIVKRLTVNGAETAFEILAKNSKAFALNVNGGATDGNVAYMTFKADTDKDYEIKFYI